jgi:hypothetical protein
MNIQQGIPMKDGLRIFHNVHVKPIRRTEGKTHKVVRRKHTETVRFAAEYIHIVVGLILGQDTRYSY